MNDTNIFVLPELDVKDVNYLLENFVTLNPAYANSPRKIELWLQWMVVTREARLALLKERMDKGAIPF